MNVVEGFAGLRVKNNEIHFNTKIPKKWDRNDLNMGSVDEFLENL